MHGSKWVAGVLSAACIGVMTFSAAGQSVVTAESRWNNQDPVPPPAAGGLTSVLTTNTTSGNQATNRYVFTPGSAAGNGGMVTIDLYGQAIDNNDRTADNYTLELRSVKSVTTNAPALFYIPSYIVGTVNFNAPGGAGNKGTSSVTGQVQIFDNTLTLVATAPIVNYNQAPTPAGGGLNANQFFFPTPAVTLPAGQYFIRASLRIAGDSNPAPAFAGAAGSSVTSDFISTAASGFSTSVTPVPANLMGSRTAVLAPQARQAFGVDGTGVNVGILEPGNAYTDNDALPAARLTLVNGPVAGNYSAEHPLATSGIVAGGIGNVDQQGIAPGAKIFSAAWASYGTGSTSGDFRAALMALSANCRIVNMSASTDKTGVDAAGDTAFTDGFILTHTDLTFVKSSGNEDDSNPGGGNITVPGRAYNIITVGALNRDFTAKASFSSYDTTADPSKPDIVAPGEYILAPSALDTNGDGNRNDANRVFLGALRAVGSPETGDISGTSFAAPHVAGAAALLMNYADTHANHTSDHRAIKAILLNSALTNIKDGNNQAWGQVKNGGGVPGNPLTVTQSLDDQLGAGMLNAAGALENFAPAEIRPGTNNTSIHQVISESLNANGKFWDMESVKTGGNVDYLLGNIEQLRSTLTWDNVNIGRSPEKLELKLYLEDNTNANHPGFNPLDNDQLVAQTDAGNENVKLLDLDPAFFGTVLAAYLGEHIGDLNIPSPTYFLEVDGISSNADTVYALAANAGLTLVPEPGSIGLLVFATALTMRRRSRR